MVDFQSWTGPTSNGWVEQLKYITQTAAKVDSVIIDDSHIRFCWFSYNCTVHFVVNENKVWLLKTFAEKCDLFTGDWIPNPSGPIYTNQSCSFIESHQNCMNNGRPDTGYLYWRWNPRDCDLPPFDPERFLEIMRNKRWALIGDSISRNHVQSLLCMLSTVLVIVIAYLSVGFA